MARAATPWLAHRLPRREPLAGRVVVSSFAFSRWIRTQEPKLVYCHSPMRQIWHGAKTGARPLSLQASAERLMGESVRRVDRNASGSQDIYIAPSPQAATLITQTYGLNVAHIVPPPVADCFFESPPAQPQESHFVWVGRVVEPVKRLSWLMRIFHARPGFTLTVIGDGRDLAAVRRSAPPNVTFFGWRSEADTLQEVRRATALLMPSREDFGLAAAEALALGVPIVATDEAGIRNWVINAENGFVSEPNLDAYLTAIDGASVHEFDRQHIRASASDFSLASFHQALRTAIARMGWTC